MFHGNDPWFSRHRVILRETKYFHSDDTDKNDQKYSDKKNDINNDILYFIYSEIIFCQLHDVTRVSNEQPVSI